jgi:hypothetical protein
MSQQVPRQINKGVNYWPLVMVSKLNFIAVKLVLKEALVNFWWSYYAAASVTIDICFWKVLVLK